jgi:hypothetical protein
MIKNFGSLERKTKKVIKHPKGYINQNSKINESTIHRYPKTTIRGENTLTSTTKALLSSKTGAVWKKFEDLMENRGILASGGRVRN